MLACSVLGLVYYFWLWSDRASVSVGLLLAWAVGCCLSSIYAFGVLFWSCILQETVHYIQKRWYQLWAIAMAWGSRPSCRSRRIRPTSSRTGHTSADPALTMSRGRRTSDETVNDDWDSSSAHHQRLSLINTSYYLLCSTNIFGSSWASAAVLCVVRLLIYGLILFMKDNRATLEHLTLHGAALGLVLDAKALLKALKAVEMGDPLPSDIPMFRATILRMRRTLAVSYRWQEDAVPITSETMSLNMSVFQMQTLAEEIPRSNCSFVWIDKLSVCQEEGELQNKLLSRMLAVFSSAQITLAMLATTEKDSDRYHCRAWTAQVTMFGFPAAPCQPA